MKTALLFLYTETSLHAGTGSSISAIDLPIQRERTTNYPNIQGSGIKGALRSLFHVRRDDDDVKAIFGPDTTGANDYAGAVSIGEARILLFPVRSLMGVFAYVTCPFVIARLEREGVQAGVLKSGEFAIPNLTGQACWIPPNADTDDNGTVILEEFAFNATKNVAAQKVAEWLAKTALPGGTEYEYWRDKLKRSLVILPDDAFAEFVQNSTEVITRVRLKPDTKTVDGGALWTQEAIPADALMVSSVIGRRVRLPNPDRRVISDTLTTDTPEAVINWLQSQVSARMQIGGDETTGYGMVGVAWAISPNKDQR